ncbi:response regulator transcription factor [Limnovirga soli]|jgi:DNA-binding response OmpR family regulator|uniref:Response regulator n=1 Tax=Limnovirga soli TaxID=2656915 RepID=A0A8J8FHA4_9BACT|nr:response regulator transcription factor [Limnovirga soli]NNV55861.1 response regulator [Limnovirga soli]
MKLLIAEDDLMLVKAIEFKLKREGYDLVIVNDGREALLKIASEKPDIIISDIMMPFINGLEIISTVRNDMKLDTPIIMLTSVGLEKTVLEAFELGADDFMTKPFSPNELVVRIRKIITSRKLQ